MKRQYIFRLFILCIFITTAGFAQFPYSDFEIVESIPVETVLDNPEIRNAQEVWLDMINHAKTSIDIEQFYISNDKNKALEPVIQAIESAAKRGVIVRVIAENRMAKTYPNTLERLDKQNNIEVRKISVFSENGGVQHAKFFIVDKEQVFLGSQNFDWRALEHIHEIGVRIRHLENAKRMTELFELDWEQCQENMLSSIKPTQEDKWMNMPVGKNQTLQFTVTASPFGNVPPGFREDLPTIIDLIDNAKERVFVQLLSYSPSDRNHFFSNLDDALKRAAGRGVNVRLLCSDWCQHKYEMPYLKDLARLENIDVKLSTIPEWSGGYISFARVEHCKMMIIDNKLSWIGTSNWKRDYFYGSRNAAIIVDDELVNQTLGKIFLKSWDGPYSWDVDPETEYSPKYYGEKD